MQGLASTPAAGTEAPAAEASTVYSVTPSGGFIIMQSITSTLYSDLC
jgi:hypothetical protein